MEANMSQWQWVQHWLHQTRNTGQLLPSGRQRACWWTVQTSTRNFCLWTCLRQRVKHWSACEVCSQCGDAQEAETRQCEEVSLRAVQDVLLDAGILKKKTILVTPQQNGSAERCNRTLQKIARCLLIDSGFSR